MKEIVNSLNEHYKHSSEMKFDKIGLNTLIGFMLGTFFGIGFMTSVFSTDLFTIGLATMALSFFHIWEFTYVAL